MDGNRFDALARAAASRRSLLGAALGGLAAAAHGGRTVAARLRTSGEICRKDGDCASGVCGPRDRTGRRYCGCVGDADCPVPGDACQAVSCVAGACVAAELGGVGAACTPADFHGGAPVGSPGTGCCRDLVCHGFAAPGDGTCYPNSAPVAVDADIKHPWQFDCIPVTLEAYDAECDAMGLFPVAFPQSGFLTGFVFDTGGFYAGVKPGDGGAGAVGPEHGRPVRDRLRDAGPPLRQPGKPAPLPRGVGMLHPHLLRLRGGLLRPPHPLLRAVLADLHRDRLLHLPGHRRVRRRGAGGHLHDHRVRDLSAPGRTWGTSHKQPSLLKKDRSCRER